MVEQREPLRCIDIWQVRCYEWIRSSVVDSAVVLEDGQALLRLIRLPDGAVRLEFDADGVATQDQFVDITTNVFGQPQEGRVDLVCGPPKRSIRVAFVPEVA